MSVNSRKIQLSWFREFKPCPHRASASVLMPGQCLAMGIKLTLGVGCPDVNQCGPLEASMLPLTLGVGRPLNIDDTIINTTTATFLASILRKYPLCSELEDMFKYITRQFMVTPWSEDICLFVFRSFRMMVCFGIVCSIVRLIQERFI